MKPLVLYRAILTGSVFAPPQPSRMADDSTTGRLLNIPNLAGIVTVASKPYKIVKIQN
jgi:hypothetical protein